MHILRPTLFLILSWMIPYGLHTLMTHGLRGRVVHIIQRTFHGARSVEAGDLSIQLGGRFEVLNTSFASPKLSASAPYIRLAPRWRNMVGRDPFFLLSVSSPKVRLHLDKGRSGPTGRPRSRSLARVLSRFDLALDNARVALEHGPHSLALGALSGRGSNDGGVVLSAKFMKYEGPLGLWIGKKFGATIQGARLQNIAIKFMKLFSQEGRELEFGGKAERIAGDALQFTLTVSSGAQFIKGTGRTTVSDRLLEMKASYGLSISALRHMAGIMGFQLDELSGINGNMAGEMALRVDQGIEKLTGKFALSDLKTVHQLLAPNPVIWPLLTGSLDYRKRQSVERLSADVLVAGKTQGAIRITKEGDRRLIIKGEVPVHPCATLLGSIPSALMPTIGDMRLSGETGISFASMIPLHDLKSLTATMEFSGEGCQLLHAPEKIDLERLKHATAVTLHDLEGRPYTRTLGPSDPLFVPLKKIPYFLVDAVLASEDMRFFQHNGFDWPLLVRALGTNLYSKRVVKGASTISQQLTKNLFLSMNRSLSRKLEEAIITWQLEQTLPKTRILEIYLNIIEMGPGLRGVQQGAKLYFQKGASYVNPLEAAHIASIIPAPRYYYKRFRKSLVPDEWGRKIRGLLMKVTRYKRLPKEELDKALKSELVIQDY